MLVIANKQYPDTVPDPNIITDNISKQNPINAKIPIITNKQYPDIVPNPNIIDKQQLIINIIKVKTNMQ